MAKIWILGKKDTDRVKISLHIWNIMSLDIFPEKNIVKVIISV